MDSTKGNVALITGASSGIGRACAFKFASEGVKVALVARTAGKLNEVVQAVEAQGGEARALVGDVTLDADVERVVRDTVAEFGGIDMLVNAAGVMYRATIEATPPDDWDRVMRINTRSVFIMIQQALPHLIQRKGSIVNVSSVSGLRAAPGLAAYCVSKAAVDQLTHCVALEVADKGVRCNAVNPGLTITDLHRNAGMSEEQYAAFLEHSKTTHPLGRLGHPEEIADLIFFLASPQAGWITGINCPIDGGRSQSCPI